MTNDEKRAINSLKRVAKKWPKTLFLFTNGNGLTVMRYAPNGKPSMNIDGSYDQTFIVDSVQGIDCEGGDW